jgi:hypothetical protein
MKWKGDSFQINGLDCAFWYFQLFDPLVPTLGLVIFGQGHIAVALECHDEIFLQVQLHKAHVLRRSKPDVSEHIFERNLVLVNHLQHMTSVFILADLASTLLFARFLVV